MLFGQRAILGSVYWLQNLSWSIEKIRQPVAIGGYTTMGKKKLATKENSHKALWTSTT